VHYSRDGLVLSEFKGRLSHRLTTQQKPVVREIGLGWASVFTVVPDAQARDLKSSSSSTSPGGITH
jgi:hypothetical protein